MLYPDSGKVAIRPYNSPFVWVEKICGFHQHVGLVRLLFDEYGSRDASPRLG